jgi:hypothetical protein
MSIRHKKWIEFDEKTGPVLVYRNVEGFCTGISGYGAFGNRVAHLGTTGSGCHTGKSRKSSELTEAAMLFEVERGQIRSSSEI